MVVGCVATITCVHGPAGERRSFGKSKRVRLVPGAPMGDLLIRWLGQANLHRLQIEEIIVLAPHDVSQPSQICDNRAIAILTIQTYHGLAQWNRLCVHIRADRASPLAATLRGLRHCLRPMPPKTCRSIDAYGPGARWSGSERFHPACAPCSLERRPCPTAVVWVEDQACRGGRLTRATCRVPSTSNTNQCLPCRSHSPPAFSSFSRGRAIRSSRNSVRNASTGA